MCDTCRFWTRDYGRLTSESDAECRRHAPAPMLYPNTTLDVAFPVAAWPITEADDWCGEHQAMLQVKP